MRWAARERARQIAALVVSLVGLLGLVSAVSAPARDRLQAIQIVVPAVAPETAGLTLVLVSMALLLMARGLRRGLRLARLATIALLAVSIVVHLLHGSPVLACVPAALAATWLAAQSRAFPVTQPRETVRRAVGVAVVGSAVGLAISTGLALVLKRSDLDAAVVTAGSLCLVGGTLWSMWSLLSPLSSLGASLDERRDDLFAARAIVRQHGTDTLAYFALRDDKQLFLHRGSVVAYAVRGGVCIVSPDPIGPVDKRAEVWTAFTSFAEANGWSVGVLGASKEWLATYAAAGLRAVYLGDEAIISCREFTPDGRARRSARQAHSRVRRAGYSVEHRDPATLTIQERDELLALAALCRQGSCERGFSMTLSRLLDPRDDGLLVSVARDAAGVAQAFIQWVPCGGGWSLDVMRRNTAPGLTNGIIEFLVIESITAFAAAGHVRVGLNFAVFRSVVSGESQHWLGRTARQALRTTASRTQIESLWRFNAKFDPEWVPRYAVLGMVDSMAAQGVVMAGAEGLTELPFVGRFMTGMTPV